MRRMNSVVLVLALGRVCLSRSGLVEWTLVVEGCTASRTASRTCSTAVVSAQIRVDLHSKNPTNTVFIGFFA